MKRVKNPWVPSRTLSTRFDLPGILVLALMSWSFYNLYDLGYRFFTRRFFGPTHE